MARLMAIQQKAQIDARFAPLFKKLGLSPDKLAQFKSLLADRLSTPIDVMTAAGQQGINPMQDRSNSGSSCRMRRRDRREDPVAPRYRDLCAIPGLRPDRTQRPWSTQLQQSLSYTTHRCPRPGRPADADSGPDFSCARCGAVAGAVYTRSTGSDGNVVVAVGPPPPDGGLAGVSWVAARSPMQPSHRPRTCFHPRNSRRSRNPAAAAGSGTVAPADVPERTRRRSAAAASSR